jgi:hypothetical protein
MTLISFSLHSSIPGLFRIWTTGAAILLGFFLRLGEATALVPDLGDIEIDWNPSDDASFGRHASCMF